MSGEFLDDDEIEFGSELGVLDSHTLKMQALISDLLCEIGEDPEREGLAKTPLRAASALRFLTQGYRQDIEKLINHAVFDENYNEMVLVKHIHFYSMCEHHLLPFFGVCHVAYLPNGKVIGLSKIPRIVDAYARRLQLQERLTNQIASSLNDHLAPRGVAVVMEAFHLCMMMRGVEKQDSRTTTSAMLGAFKDNPQTRNEFLSLIQTNSVNSLGL